MRNYVKSLHVQKEWIGRSSRNGLYIDQDVRLPYFSDSGSLLHSKMFTKNECEGRWAKF